MKAITYLYRQNQTECRLVIPTEQALDVFNDIANHMTKKTPFFRLEMSSMGTIVIRPDEIINLSITDAK